MTCPMCHHGDGKHGDVRRPGDPTRPIRCPNEAIDTGEFIRIRRGPEVTA